MEILILQGWGLRFSISNKLAGNKMLLACGHTLSSKAHVFRLNLHRPTIPSATAHKQKWLEPC